MGAKAEIRNPKPETRNKSETRNPNLPQKNPQVAKEGKIMGAKS